MTVINLFAGISDWGCEGSVGMEMNADACATRSTAGLRRTIRADVTTLDPARFGDVDGVCASPPCQDFSVAGKRLGIDGERGRLVLEVPRWVESLRPRWVVCEQVPPVLAIWERFAHRFRGWGYRTWTGLLSCERYGIPQTRQRAILMASLDHQPHPPEPTHQAYVHGQPAMVQDGLFGGLLPWVSMADALGWGEDREIEVNNVTSTTSERYRRPMADPSPTVGGAGRNWRSWWLHHPRGEGMVERHGDREGRHQSEPSFLVTGKARSWYRDGNPGQVVLRAGSTSHAAPAPAPTILGNIGKQNGWCWERPAATTIATDSSGRAFRPGGHHGPGSQSRDAIRLTVREGLILQGFPEDYPVQGSKTSQWLQVGNAFPPPVAKMIVDQLT